MKAKPSTRGFSVAGLLVAAGVMSGLALVLSQLSRRQMVIQRKAETGVEVAELSRKITRALQDGNACFETIRRATTTLDTSAAPYSVSDIMERGRGGNPPQAFLTQGGTYRNRLVRIDSMELTDVAIGGDIGQLNLKVTFEKNSRAITGQKTVIKTFPLAVQLAPATTPPTPRTVLSCISLRDGALDVAKREVCPEMGGLYNPDGTCTSRLLGQECPPGDATATPPVPRQYLQGIDTNHNLVCAVPPPSSPHPPKFNCYLLTTYNFFNYQDANIPWDNMGSLGNEPVKRWRIKLKNSGTYRNQFVGAPPNPSPGDYNGKEACESGYTQHFHRSHRMGNNKNQSLVFHYCCR